MTPFHIEPDWKWGTSEGSREFDRLVDRSLTLREKLEWLEEMETLTLRMLASRMKTAPGGPPIHPTGNRNGFPPNQNPLADGGAGK